MRILIFLLFLTPSILLSQNVGINNNGNSPDPSAMLDVQSTTQGMLVPRMTSADRVGINNPAQGLLVFDTTLGAFHVYSGTSWKNLSNALLSDADEDTKVEVEKNPDEDKIRFTIDNSNKTTIHKDRIDMPTVLGFEAGNLMSTGNANNNTVLGFKAMKNTVNGHSNIALGTFAGENKEGARNIMIGNNASRYDTTGYDNIAIGENAGQLGKLYDNIYIGNEAGMNNSGFGAVFIGANAGQNNIGVGNVMIGDRAGHITTGGGNVLIGRNAGRDNISGLNTFIGAEAGALSNGDSNVYLGANAAENSDGLNNVVIGSQTAKLTDNLNESVIIGSLAAFRDTGSVNNVIIGYNAGSGGANITSNEHDKKENVLVGHRAGWKMKGDGNTALGFQAGQNNEGMGNVFIGKSAGENELGNDKLYIENSNSSTPLIHGDFANDVVTIHDRLEIENNTPSNTAVYSVVTGGSSTAISGRSISTSSSPNTGGGFRVDGPYDYAVRGQALHSGNAQNYGGHFTAFGSFGRGVYGSAGNTSTTVTNYGGYFISSGINGIGVFANATGSSGVGLKAEGNLRAAIFDGQTEMNGEVHLNAPVNDSELYMKSASGNDGRVIVRQQITEDVYLGDVDQTGGDALIMANGTTIAKFGQNGRIGIGTLSPFDRFQIDGNTGEGAFRVRLDGITRLRVHANGGVSIGQNATPPAEGLRVLGTAEKPGGGMWAATSDRRLKTEIEKYEAGLADVLQINPVSYKYNEISGLKVDKSYVGIIAQELKKIRPSMVFQSETPEKYLKVDPNEFIYMLINATKELEALVSNQQKQIDQLKDELEINKKSTTSFSASNSENK